MFASLLGRVCLLVVCFVAFFGVNMFRGFCDRVKGSLRVLGVCIRASFGFFLFRLVSCLLAILGVGNFCRCARGSINLCSFMQINKKKNC